MEEESKKEVRSRVVQMTMRKISNPHAPTSQIVEEIKKEN